MSDEPATWPDDDEDPFSTSRKFMGEEDNLENRLRNLKKREEDRKRALEKS